MAGAAVDALDAKGPAPAMAAVAREAASAKALALASLSASLRVIIVRSPRQGADFLSLAAAALRVLLLRFLRDLRRLRHRTFFIQVE
jgi:hypothetical protein